LNTVPAAEQFVVDTLQSLRIAGSTINSIVISALMKSVLAVQAPQLLEKLSLSRRWCRYWLKRRLGWRFKKATTSGQKLPKDWQQQVLNMKMRVAATASMHGITHKCFVINWDQTAVMLLSTHKYTYHNKEDKQVPVIGLEEKRQITAVVAGALSGELLPMQLIFTGQDKNKKQQKAVPTLDLVTKDRVTTAGWHLTQTSNHWSTQDSMKDYLRCIIDPWIQKKRAEHNCPDSHVILLFDCWSVHKSDEFLNWLKSTYTLYHPVFIPAGCTGKAQPADVVLQRPLKSDFNNEYTAWMNSELMALIKSGANPSQLKVDTGLARMKPLLVKWMYHSWSQLATRTVMIERGWAKCGLADVFDVTVQQQACKLIMTKQLGLESDDQPEEAESTSEADAAMLQEEADACDAEDVEDDEEEMDVDVCLAACIEDTRFVGVRRSARVSAGSADRASKRVAQLLQEQTEQEACYID
jgi:hypothetical protein